VILTLPNLMDVWRTVLRISPSTVTPGTDMPKGNTPALEPTIPNGPDRPSARNLSGTPVAVRRSDFLKALQHAKPASALRPGDAIRLETGERVVITYVSVGFAPTDRYIEWRGPLLSNWANVRADVQVLLA
jgi:hypothetical protein